MSDETARRLAKANDDVRTTSAALEAAQRDLLSFVARALPQRVDQVARRVSQEQPETARALGKDGIATLRQELAEAAAEVAAEFESATDRIEWPSGYFDQPDQVRRALHDHLQVRKFHGILVRNKFQVQSPDDYGHGSRVGAYELLPEVHDVELRPLLEAVAAALVEARSAKRDQVDAQKADDLDAVESLWDD